MKGGREGPRPYRQAVAFAGYVDRVFRAFFQHSLDIGDPAVLRAIAEDACLPGASFAEALLEGRYSATHQAQLATARTLGIKAVPRR